MSNFTKVSSINVRSYVVEAIQNEPEEVEVPHYIVKYCGFTTLSEEFEIRGYELDPSSDFIIFKKR
jgi:hypothetical protein